MCNNADATLRDCRQNARYGIFFWTAGQRVDPSRRSTFVWRETSTYADIENLSLMSYTNWYPSEPDYGLGKYNDNEACVNLWSTSRMIYKWNDNPCSSLHCSVCEIDM